MLGILTLTDKKKRSKAYPKAATVFLKLVDVGGDFRLLDE